MCWCHWGLRCGESWNATAELHLGRGRSRRRGGGGADWGGLSCHIPQGESSWAPCPYLGRRCLLTWVCGMPRQDASSSPGGWGRLRTVGAKSRAKSANFGIEDPSRPRHLRVGQVQSLRRQSALSAKKKKQRPPFVGGLLCQPTNSRGRSYSLLDGLLSCWMAK